MSVTVQLTVGGTPVPDAFYDAISQLEVEESSDRPGTLLLRLPVNRTSAGDLQFVGDGTFEPLTNVSPHRHPGHRPGRRPVHLRRVRDCPGGCTWTGRRPRRRIDIWAQDASWLMNIDDNVAEWPGLTDGEVANAIFASYGFTPAAGNTDNDSPSHTARRATRCSSARPTCSSCAAWPDAAASCAGSPAPTPPGQRTGYFVRPAVDGPAGGDDLAGRPRPLDGRHAGLRLGRHAPDPGRRQPGRPRPRPRRRAPTVTTDHSGLSPLRPAILRHLPRPDLDAAADRARRRAELGQRTAAVLAEPGSSPAAPERPTRTGSARSCGSATS